MKRKIISDLSSNDYSMGNAADDRNNKNMQQW